MLKKLLLMMSVLGVALGLGFALLRFWKAPLYSSFSRGQALAERLGCFACHGPGGTSGIANPGSDEKTVPTWDGGTLMMYAKNEEEIREWILDGMPQRLRGRHEHHGHNGGEDHHQGHQHEGEALIDMPAFRDKVTSRELEDLVSFVKAVGWTDEIQDPLARKGREVALEKGCLGCHGPEGRSPMPNPGSLKGYIPPWDSKDFGELVKNDEELEEWILNGVTRRFQNNRLANFFVERQKIHMPPYKKHLSPEELSALKAYIRWVAKK